MIDQEVVLTATRRVYHLARPDRLTTKCSQLVDKALMFSRLPRICTPCCRCFPAEYLRLKETSND